MAMLLPVKISTNHYWAGLYFVGLDNPHKNQAQWTNIWIVKHDARKY